MNANYAETTQIGNYRIRTNNFNLFFYFVISVFFLNDTVRSIFGEKVGWINFPFLIVGMPYIIYSFIKGKIRPLFFYVTCFFSVLVLIVAIFHRENIGYFFMTLANLLTPLFLLSVKLDKDNTNLSFRTFVRLFNALIIVLLIIGIVDYLTHSSIQLKLSETVFYGLNISELINQEYNWGIYRYYSIIGHPLTNARYFLIFFIMNAIYAKYQKPIMNGYFVSVITILGLFLSGSKTGIILGIMLIIFFSAPKKSKFVYFSTIILAVIIFLNTPLFQNNLKQRFLQGVESGDITSGRNVLIEMLVNSGEKPNLIFGGGSGYSIVVAQNLNGDIFNFEYPPIMFAFDYGIVATSLMYLCILIFPMIIFLRKKKFFIFLTFVILSFMVNTSNSLSSLGSDSMSQLCLILFILLNLINVINENDEIISDRKEILQKS